MKPIKPMMKSTSKVSSSKTIKTPKASTKSSTKSSNKSAAAYGSKPPKAKPIKNAAADATVGKAQKRKEKITKIAGMGATAAYAIGDMINTRRRLTGKSYIKTKTNP
jgi:hypothetical protein